MKPTDEPYAYFQPCEMLFIISHEDNEVPTNEEIDQLLTNELNGGLIGWSNETNTNRSVEISRVKGRELHFPGTKGLPPSKQEITILQANKYKSPLPAQRGAFSIIPAEIRISESLRNEENPEGYVTSKELTEIIVGLDRDREGLEKVLNSTLDSRKGMKVEVISPNWLSSPSSEYGGGGGPGGRPVPYKGPIDTRDYEFQLPPYIEQLCPEKGARGQGVKVAIFDTAPCLHDLAEAYEAYHKVNPEKQKQQRREKGRHPLIESLLRPHGPLHIHPASFEELLRMRAVHLRDHNYKMTDHGLFVAGIIHTIAPAAEIHLYEVLNPDGVGDLESIARGLWKVADKQYRTFKEEGKVQPLVVNCSLVLNIPLNGDTNKPSSAGLIKSNPKASLPLVGHRLTDIDQPILDQINYDPEWIERSGSLIKWICDLLFLCGSRVIAAAGNDWRQAEDAGRPQARYPAAYESALGVGALPKGQPLSTMGHHQVSSYSNLSDIPGEIGVTAIGGEKGEGEGILGVYLGSFPDGNAGPNTKNWAWWSGTSFATPIVSGTITAILSCLNRPATTEEAIITMYNEAVILNAETDYLEDRLSVRQEASNI